MFQHKIQDTKKNSIRDARAPQPGEKGFQYHEI